jgi:hypothetical protein
LALAHGGRDGTDGHEGRPTFIIVFIVSSRHRERRRCVRASQAAIWRWKMPGFRNPTPPKEFDSTRLASSPTMEVRRSWIQRLEELP